MQKWNDAATRIRGLDWTDSCRPDDAALIPLPRDIQRRADLELEEPVVADSLQLLPRKWTLVNTDQLILHQRSVDLSHVNALKASFPTRPTEADLFCLAAGRVAESVQLSVTRTPENLFAISSPSSDIRLLDMPLFDPAALNGYRAPSRWPVCWESSSYSESTLLWHCISRAG